jgi:hypothetical protein
LAKPGHLVRECLAFGRCHGSPRPRVFDHWHTTIVAWCDIAKFSGAQKGSRQSAAAMVATDQARKSLKWRRAHASDVPLDEGAKMTNGRNAVNARFTQ